MSSWKAVLDGDEAAQIFLLCPILVQVTSLLLGRRFVILLFSVCPQEVFKTISHKHTYILHTTDQGAPLKDIAIDIEITEEGEVSSLLDQREINSNDAPGVTEAQTEGQDSLAGHSNTKVLIKDRDPKGISKCLKVTFEDVIAEPVSVRSFDKVWLWSHALFEVSRLWFYRIISLLLAVPVALAAGILFAVISSIHIWLIVPSVQLLAINLHWMKVVWHSVLDTAISPFFSSFGKCWGFIRISLEKY